MRFVAARSKAKQTNLSWSNGTRTLVKNAKRPVAAPIIASSVSNFFFFYKKKNCRRAIPMLSHVPC